MGAVVLVVTKVNLHGVRRTCDWWMKDCKHGRLDQNIQFYFEEGVRVFMDF